MLCHVTTAAALEGPWLETKPFLHCCTEAQLAFVLGGSAVGFVPVVGEAGSLVPQPGMFSEQDVDGGRRGCRVGLVQGNDGWQWHWPPRTPAGDGCRLRSRVAVRAKTAYALRDASLATLRPTWASMCVRRLRVAAGQIAVRSSAFGLRYVPWR